MNWLAHILLSKKSIDYQLGNILADPLKGKCWPDAHPSVKEGFAMHRRIDAFTDTNEYFLKSKSRLGKKGYLKGVIVDMIYDHLLLKHWDEFSAIDINTFINQFYHHATQTIIHYPDEAQHFIERIIQSKVLTSYATVEGLALSFQRIDYRLSKRILAKESASDYTSVIEGNMLLIEEDFIQFFPQMIAFFKYNSQGGTEEYWLR
ncbi:MAG: ACP phosphodiesterase [Cellvibrionaceae bacterium]